MARFWRALHRLTNSSGLQLVVGTLVAGSGLWDLVHESQAGGLTFRPSHGVTLLGLVTALVAMEHLLLGVKMTGRSIAGEQERSGARGVAQLSRRFVDNPYFEIALGIMLLAGGLGEAYLDYTETVRDHDDRVWHLGLVFLGLIEFVKGATGAMTALILVEQAERQLGRHWRLVERVGAFLRAPRFEMVVATCLIALGLWEELVYEKAPQDGQLIEAHLGMVLLALNNFARHLPTLFIGAETLDDAGHSR